MGLYKRPDSPHWQYSFTVKGNRFRGSTETEDREIAEAVASKLKNDIIFGRLANRRPEMTLDTACARYWLGHAADLSSAKTIEGHTAELLAAFGKNRNLSDFPDAAVSEAVAVWRATVANATCNRRLGTLRAIMRKARDEWGAEVREPNWKAHRLLEPEDVQHILTAEEEGRLFAALRPDYHAFVRFALLTGLRLESVLTLEWRQVDWDAKTIWFRIKSRNPGRALHVLPLTPDVAAILSLERGRHPSRVFTYLCDRNRHDPKRRARQEKGRRYPFTKDGWRKAWKGALQAAEIPDLRFHDLRHTAGTRTLAADKNLPAVQRMLGHKDIKTTMRYARVSVDDVRAAMEAAASRSRHVTMVPEGKKKDGTDA